MTDLTEEFRSTDCKPTGSCSRYTSAIGLTTTFFRELQRLDKPARYKDYAGENFYVRGFEKRMEMLADMKAFFDFHLLGKDAELPGVGVLEELEGVSH